MEDLAPSQSLKAIRREANDTFNRLRSIDEDAKFVTTVACAYPHLSLYPNLRCGAWYTDSEIAVMHPPVYFKSTDGHAGNWDFNLRRANLHLLSERFQGMLIVDSTRRGKRMPDALSKTVPIWCAVINRALELLHNLEGWDSRLYTPPTIVSPSEHDQISSCIERWAEKLTASTFTLPRLSKPIRPVWITPATTTFPDLRNLEFFPVVCISASKLVSAGMEQRASGGFTYVQGSGDDHESWSEGLTPELFWKHKPQILACHRGGLSSLISELTTETTTTTNEGVTPIDAVRGLIGIGSWASPPTRTAPNSAMIYITTIVSHSGPPSPPSSLFMFNPPGKKGQMIFLQHTLPLAIDFVKHHLSEGKQVLIGDDNGGCDLAIGVAVAALATFFDEQGNLLKTRHQLPSKGHAKVRLEWIQTSRPVANPSRTTMKRVNEFLMSPPKARKV